MKGMVSGVSQMASPPETPARNPIQRSSRQARATQPAVSAIIARSRIW